MSTLQSIIDAPTPAKAYAKALGFDYRGATVQVDGQDIVIKGTFECVCEKIETFVFKLPVSMLDPAHLLRLHGAFSEEHLREDGYSESAIQSILAKAKDLQ